MIEGEENFRLKYQKMNEAKSSIYIANYDLDPNLQLIRGDTISREISLSSSINMIIVVDAENIIAMHQTYNYR